MRTDSFYEHKMGAKEQCLSESKRTVTRWNSSFQEQQVELLWFATLPSSHSLLPVLRSQLENGRQAGERQRLWEGRHLGERKLNKVPIQSERPCTSNICGMVSWGSKNCLMNEASCVKGWAPTTNCKISSRPKNRAEVMFLTPLRFYETWGVEEPRHRDIHVWAEVGSSGLDNWKLLIIVYSNFAEIHTCSLRSIFSLYEGGLEAWEGSEVGKILLRILLKHLETMIFPVGAGTRCFVKLCGLKTKTTYRLLQFWEPQERCAQAQSTSWRELAGRADTRCPSHTSHWPTAAAGCNLLKGTDKTGRKNLEKRK